MKREDVKNKIPGITEEQLNWIMQENGNDVNREKAAATALQAQLDNANAQLKTAQDGLKAFEARRSPRSTSRADQAAGGHEGPGGRLCL